MATDSGGIADAVEAVLNGDSTTNPDAKGPGPEWDNPDDRVEGEYVPTEVDVRTVEHTVRRQLIEGGEVRTEDGGLVTKGPDPDEWGDTARAARDG